MKSYFLNFPFNTMRQETTKYNISRLEYKKTSQHNQETNWLRIYTIRRLWNNGILIYSYSDRPVVHQIGVGNVHHMPLFVTHERGWRNRWGLLRQRRRRVEHLRTSIFRIQVQTVLALKQQVEVIRLEDNKNHQNIEVRINYSLREIFTLWPSIKKYLTWCCSLVKRNIWCGGHWLREIVDKVILVKRNMRHGCVWMVADLKALEPPPSLCSFICLMSSRARFKTLMFQIS